MEFVLNRKDTLGKKTFGIPSRKKKSDVDKTRSTPIDSGSPLA